MYLLQLVQALKFEHTSVMSSTLRHGRVSQRKRDAALLEDEDCGLSQFLIDRSVANPILGTAFHWYLMIECEDRGAVGKMYAKVAFRYMKKLSEVSVYSAYTS